MPELRRDRPADSRYVVGSSGSGKTFYLRSLLARARRALVWDWKNEHDDLETLDLARLASWRCKGAVRYVPNLMLSVPAQFDLFCRIAWELQLADPRDLLFAVEELSEVTTASYAPPAWRRIVTQGRVLGFVVVGTTQRPAYVDKSFTGNATLIRAGRLGELRDAQVIGQRIGVAAVDLQRLPDRHAYVYDGRAVRFEAPKA